MRPTWQMAQKKNLLLALDAFGTLYTPKRPVHENYGRFAQKYGIDIKSYDDVKSQFRAAFKDASKKHPNYGKATGLGAEKWWTNVIQGTFQPNLKSGQEASQELVDELLKEYSTCSGYRMYPDVKPFLQHLKSKNDWNWDRTIVGVITNSDDRVPSILESFGVKVGPRRAGAAQQWGEEVNELHDIDFVVLSYDVGYEKPDRRIFDAASQMLKEIVADNSQEAEFEKLYVGDAAENDYFGAKKAGWHAIHLTRQESGSESKDFTIKKTSISTIDEQGGRVQVQVPTIVDLRALKYWSPHA